MGANALAFSIGLGIGGIFGFVLGAVFFQSLASMFTMM